ncbi:MerR family transcriptional regulator [Adlercreutzia sp. R7]|uniref:MerR family transcriptional regulator n=1 Tax=Adlercreutzia wanghongyangiae TaxID=3111451 RepID=A0ABU6IJM6_9ACTN|nr:MerR family transcriptional regulator [Adlercreutzia sp. R7]
MPGKPRTQTSNDLIRENCEWPMTAGQVAKLTGVTTRALQHYDDKGLLCPARSGEGVANNRKLYSPEDVDRLKQIVVLSSYGFELKDMPPILDGERSLVEALAERIEELRAQERYLQNLILFARYAAIVGDDLFETLAFGTSDVDAFAELVRSSPAYADKTIRWESMDDAGLEQLWDELGAIIVDFLGGDEEDIFAHIESTVRRLRVWFCTYFFEIDDLDLLGIWTLFEDGSEEAEFAGEVGGEATPGFLQSAVFLVWLKSMILKLSSIVEVGAEADAKFSLSENQVVALVDFVCRSCGYPVPEAAELDGDEWATMVEFFETVAGYLGNALSDEETIALIDPDSESSVDGAFFERAAQAAREVELFSERG